MKRIIMIAALAVAYLCLPAQNTMRITFLEPSPVLIGGKICKNGDSFSSEDIVQWSISSQVMTVYDTSTGKIRAISATEMNQSGHKTIWGYISGSKRLSTRDVDSIAIINPPYISMNRMTIRDDYETWAQTKRDEYDQWKKMRAEIVSRLPKNPDADRISSFIDAGFESTSTVTPAPQSSTAVKLQQPTSLPASGKIKVWVVIAGISDYADCCRSLPDSDNNKCHNISCLNYTDDDAYRMYAFYKSKEGGSLPDAQIQLLIDEDATQNNILVALNNVFSKASSSDAIVFYFSGHGSSSSFIAHDYNKNGNGLLEHARIREIFDHSSARYKYIIADACHSGNLAKTGEYYQAFNKNNNNLAMLLSSMGGEYSAESNGIRQGIFSYYILRGLKGEADTNHDNVVSIVELFDFVKQNVENATNSKQHPIIAGSYDEKYPVAVVENNL